MSEWESPIDGSRYGTEEEPGRIKGLTYLDKAGRIRIFIAWQRVAPLLREGLNSVDILAEPFFVAKTIFHELMVRLCSLSTARLNGRNSMRLTMRSKMSNARTSRDWITTG
jgi:hypothetical protein